MTKKKNRKQHDRPRILVLGGGMREQVEAAGAEYVYQSYTDTRAIEAAGHDNIHALILTGGSDVSPDLYKQAPHKFTQAPNHQRDDVEVRALHAASKRGIPVLGVCRGSQLINVAYGGTLHQNIEDLPNTHAWHLGHDHRVDLLKGTRLRRVLDVEQPYVVSIHHQAVDRVARGFRVAARSRDGIIEAIESTWKGSWILGVQFHPEMATGAVMQRIYNELAIQAARRGGLPTPKPRPRKQYVPQQYTPTPAPTPTRLSADRWEGTKVVPTPMLWQCFHCGIMFDEQVDHVDHMFFLHGIDLLDIMTDGEIQALVAEDEAEDYAKRKV